MSAIEKGPAAGKSGQGQEVCAISCAQPHSTSAPQQAQSVRVVLPDLHLVPLAVRMGDLPMDAYLEGYTPTMWRATTERVCPGMWRNKPTPYSLKKRLLPKWQEYLTYLRVVVAGAPPRARQACADPHGSLYRTARNLNDHGWRHGYSDQPVMVWPLGCPVPVEPQKLELDL